MPGEYSPGHLPHCFEHFLYEVAQAYPDSLNVLQLDQGSFHKAKQLQIPENVLLMFQPPHSPELNPIERLWQYLKQQLAWGVYDSLEQLRHHLAKKLDALEPHVVASLTGWDYILESLYVAGI